ncbi:MAG TPA: sulfite exporter TauE/SafE family protein [Alphaproteobacteria bacterium]
MDVLTQLFGGANVVVAIAAALAAGLLRGFSGFGSAMLMAPIFAILFGSADMVATVVAMELAISFHLFPAARRDCDWTVVAPMTIAACIAMPLGLWLLVSLDRVLLSKIVSALVALFAAVMLAGWRWTGMRGAFPSAVVGTISGAMMATTSVGGPPVLLYMLSSDDSPATVRANAITYYFATQILLLALMFGVGIVGTAALLRAAVLFPFMLAGSWLGVRLFRGADERFYRRVALALLLAVGVFGLLR